jgi:integrase
MPTRESKTWRGQVQVRGQRSTQSGFQTKAKARDWENEERKRLKQTTLITYSLLSNKYLEYVEARYTKRVYEEKRLHVQQFVGFLGADLAIEGITAEHANNWLLGVRQSQSANAANKRRKNLLAMWNWGKRVLDLESNPFSKTEKYPHEPKTPVVPTEAEILKLLASVSGQDRVILETYINTGARRSEVFRLQWSDVNFEQRTLRVGTRKTRDGSMRYRTLPINQRLFEWLEWWWKNRTFKESLHVFVDDQKGPHYGKPYEVRRRFMRGLCKRAGIREFGFHALRHHFTSVLADKHKISTPTLQKFLGHQSPNTTAIYTHAVSEGARAAVEALNDSGRFREDYSAPLLIIEKIGQNVQK